MFLLTMHPHIIGHRSRMPLLERLIRHMKAGGRLLVRDARPGGGMVREWRLTAEGLRMGRCSVALPGGVMILLPMLLLAACTWKTDA